MVRRPTFYSLRGPFVAGVSMLGACRGVPEGPRGASASSSGGASETDEPAEGETEDSNDSSGGDAPGEPSASTAIRRLSNHELTQTIEILTGLTPAALQRLPPEGEGFVFERVVDGQTISRTHLEVHLAIADEVIHSLLAQQRLDELASACGDVILPPATASSATAVSGSGLTGAPQWACSPPADDPSVLQCLYAPAPVASYNHHFPAAGVYDLRLALQLNAAAFIDLRVGDELVHSEAGVAGDTLVHAQIEVTAAGSIPIAFELSTTPNNDNLSVHFETLTVEGPLDLGQVTYGSERDACAEALIDEFAPLVFRAPLKPEQRERLQDLIDAGTQEQGFGTGLRMLFEALLASPRFVYLLELGEEEEPGRFVLSGWELAARLSYALCQQPPDAALRDAAAADELRDPEVLETHARRLLAQPCGRATTRAFYEQWLELDEVPELSKSPEVFPEFDEQVRAGLYAESQRFIDEMVWNEHASFETFFSTNLAWPDPRSAALWGLEDLEQGQRVELGPQRAGPLTSPGVLAALGEFDGTSPVTRGVFVVEHLLCNELPPPPEDVEIVPPPPDPELSTRERWEAHSSVPECASCHALIDPPGFALEDFDGIGRHRTHEGDLPVDARGGLPGIEGEMELVGGAELSRALAGSQLASACFAKQWLRFALGRLDVAQDSPTLELLSEQARSAAMEEVLVALVKSPAFAVRYEESP